MFRLSERLGNAGPVNRRLLVETVYEECMSTLNSLFEAKPGLEPLPPGAREPKEFLKELEPILLSCISMMVPHAIIMGAVYKVILKPCLREAGFVVDMHRLATNMPETLVEKIKTCAEEEVENYRRKNGGAMMTSDYTRVNKLIIVKCVEPILNCIDTANSELYQSYVAAAPQRT